MSKSDAFENAWLKLVFQNVTIAGIGDATGIVGSATAGNLDISIHTSDPGETGNQTTGEISYTGYGRQAVPRTTGAWTVTANSVSPAATITFTISSGGTGGTVTHWAAGSALTGTGMILYSGAVSPTCLVSSGITPTLTTATAVTED